MDTIQAAETSWILCAWLVDWSFNTGWMGRDEWSSDKVAIFIVNLGQHITVIVTILFDKKIGLCWVGSQAKSFKYCRKYIFFWFDGLYILQLYIRSWFCVYLHISRTAIIIHTYYNIICWLVCFHFILFWNVSLQCVAASISYHLRIIPTVGLQISWTARSVETYALDTIIAKQSYYYVNGISIV